MKRFLVTLFLTGFLANGATASDTLTPTSQPVTQPTTVIYRDNIGGTTKTLAQLCQEILDNWHALDKAISGPGCYLNVRCNWIRYRLRALQINAEQLYHDYNCAIHTGAMPQASPF